MQRHQIIRKIQNRLKRIEKIEAEILELKKQNFLHSDRNMQFVEQEEQVLISGRPKVYETKLVGRIYFKNTFVDEETGDKFSIKRSQVVRINGEWVKL